MVKKVLSFAVCTLLASACTVVSDVGAVYDSAPAPERPFAPPARMKSAGGGMVALNGNSAGGYFQQSDRMMAYTAGFTLTVKSRDKALAEVKLLAEKLGGYLVSSVRGNMKLKVPAKKADEFLKTAGSYGKLSDFRIAAEDLTDTITDLGVRLDNLRKLRTRLTELLAKAKNVDEMLKVERELNRITTEIERMDAQLQNNKNRVDFVEFDVAVIEEHGALPSGNPQAVNQFKFLKNLSSVLVGDEDEPCFGLALPENFVAVREGRLQADSFAATTSDDCIFRTWEAEIPDGSTLDFWQSIVCRALVVLHRYDNIKCFPAGMNGRKAVKITAELTTASGIQLYMAVISVYPGCFDDELRIVEFFGPQEAFKKHEKAVSAVLQK
jgi:hypothetical protein